MSGISPSGCAGHSNLALAIDAGARRYSLYKLERREALQKYLFIAIGGALGSVARFWVGSTISGRMGIKFPYGTLVVNLTACVIIGFTLTYLGKRADLNPAWRFLVPVGFIGAYSTFSTFEWETLSTLRSGAFFLAALYTIGSMVLGLIAVWSGSWLAEIL
jgi:CrcB protein